MKDFFRFRSELLEGKKKQKQTNEASTKELKDLDLGDDVMVNGKMGMFYGMQGSKVKVRFPSGQETVPAKDVEVMNLMMDDLEKDSDDPCWDGYVQLGTKMKNGKEVPNCVPMEEARKKMMNEAKVTDDHWAIVKRNGNFYSGKSEILKIVKPDLRGNPPSMKMINTYGGDSAVKVGELKKALKGKRNTDKLMKQLSESYYDKPDYGQNSASEMKITQRIELLEETKPKSGDREAYKKFFNKALKKFGADSLTDLDDDEQKEFFNYVDKNWESEDEKTVTEATAEITRFGNDKEKSDVMSLAKKMGLKVKDTGDGIELSGNMKKISDIMTTAQKRGAKIEESKRISSRDDAHKEIEKTMAKGREVQEIGEYVYMMLKMGGRIDIEKMKRSAAKMKRNAPEIIDAMISMGLIETIGGKIRNIHPQYHVYEST